MKSEEASAALAGTMLTVVYKWPISSEKCRVNRRGVTPQWWVDADTGGASSMGSRRQIQNTTLQLGHVLTINFSADSLILRSTSQIPGYLMRASIVFSHNSF